MARYKCLRCGTESPHNKSCFVCGGKKKEIDGPDFATVQKTKKTKKIERHRKSI